MKFLLTAAALVFVTGCSTNTVTQRQPQQSTDIGNSVPDDRGIMFKNLKMYRSYFQIQLQSKTAEQFEIWFEQDGNGWDSFQMAVQADEKFTDIPEDRRLSDNQATAGWPSPPKKLVRPPRELEGVAQRIKNAVPKTFPKEKIKQVLITYMGRAARVRAFQYVPTAPYDPKQSWRRGTTAEKHYLVNTKTGKVKEFGGASSGGGSLDEPRDTTVPTSWVPVQLAAEAEGNPILGLSFYDEPGETPSCLVNPLKKAEKQVMKAIVNRVKEMESGTGLTSDQVLAKILAAQGNEDFPSNMEQRLLIYGYVYGGSSDNMGNAIDSNMEIPAPFKMNNEIKYKDIKTGIDFNIKLDLTNQKLAIEAMLKGQVDRAETALFEIPIVNINGRPVLHSSIDTVNRIRLNLPGTGQIKNFDISFGRISPSPFLLPAGVNCK